MQYEQVYSFMIDKLRTALPSYLIYHDVQHTKNVIAAAEKIAAVERVDGEELVLLKTAALFHDAGFLRHHDEHEKISCDVARKYLPDFDYSEQQIDRICLTIMATRLPQKPHDKMGEILCDADLFYLGGNEYEPYAEKLFLELKKTGATTTEPEWLLKQAEFLSTHRYFTKSVREERDANKQKNLKGIQDRLHTITVVNKKKSRGEVAWDVVQVLLGAFIAAIALKKFLVPNHFFDGGITGISLLVHEIYGYNLGVVILLFNLPLIILSYFIVGKNFAFRTLISVILLGVFLLLLPDFAVTKDKLLIAVFGGAFLGIGIGLIMRVGAALDGIEVLALYTLKRTSFTITEIILGINILIFSAAGFNFGIETALYSVLTYFTATRTIDYVVEGLQAHTGVTIVSGKSEVIKYQLVNTLGKGITVYKGERGFLPGKFDESSECDIIFTVISRLEMRKLKNLVYGIDPNAFISASTIKDTSGGIIKRKARH